MRLISVLLEQRPAASREKDGLGYKPLHLVCRYRPTLEVVELLFRQYPGAVHDRDNRGHTPLQLVSLFRPNETEVVLYLIKKNPEGLLP